MPGQCYKHCLTLVFMLIFFVSECIRRVYILISYNIIPIMIKKVMLSIDEEVLEQFDEHRGLVRRSAAINKLMQNELEHGGGLLV